MSERFKITVEDTERQEVAPQVTQTGGYLLLYMEADQVKGILDIPLKALGALGPSVLKEWFKRVVS